MGQSYMLERMFRRPGRVVVQWEGMTAADQTPGEMREMTNLRKNGNEPMIKMKTEEGIIGEHFSSTHFLSFHSRLNVPMYLLTFAGTT